MLTQKDDSIILSSVYSSLAQLVEHAAVNRRVVGSSPTGGAKVLPPLGVAAILLLTSNPEMGL